ncbi:FAD-binding oxidoreductase [Acidisphaera sp. S103]|uniref:NAD(P)/FAD-dependent oxidoreductase n=1 Tax=Acidisphaera sp. S103 TaxID=1747223 RepID=UPI00131E1A70|nr:FAD-dependent oxidoreductase [Acidisphaera sp. S103]
MRIVIIGAGVLGASAAFHLTRAGAAVTVVDAHLDGRATAAGAGIICPWVSGVEDPVFYRLYAGGGEYYPDLIAALAEAGETDLGYRRTGAMLVSGDPHELAWMERSARQRHAPAMDQVSRLSPAEAQALFPPLRPNLGGVHVAGGARVDGRRLAAALLRAARTPVMQGLATLAVEANRIVGVDIGDERIPADRVIVTAGAWADPVLRPLGLGLPVQPQRGQIMHLRLEGVETQDWPVILPPGSHYIVPFDNGRIVAGATRETAAGFDYRVTAAGQAEVLSEALRIAPGLAEATMIETRVGFRPVGAETRPLLGWVRGVAGLAVGNGLGAAGLTIGPFAGRLLADLVTGQPGLIDLAPFDPMRRMRSPVEAVALR